MDDRIGGAAPVPAEAAAEPEAGMEQEEDAPDGADAPEQPVGVEHDELETGPGPEGEFERVRRVRYASKRVLQPGGSYDERRAKKTFGVEELAVGRDETP